MAKFKVGDKVWVKGEIKEMNLYRESFKVEVDGRFIDQQDLRRRKGK